MKSNVKMNTTSLAQQLRTTQNLLGALRKQRDICIIRNRPNEELVMLTARVNEIAKEANTLKKIIMSNSSNQQQQLMVTQPQEEAVSNKKRSLLRKKRKVNEKTEGDAIAGRVVQPTKTSTDGFHPPASKPPPAVFPTKQTPLAVGFHAQPRLAAIAGRVVQPSGAVGFHAQPRLAAKTSAASFPPLALGFHPQPRLAAIAGHAVQPTKPPLAVGVAFHALDAIAGDDWNARMEASRARKERRKSSADGSTKKQPPPQPQPAAGLKTKSDDPTMKSGELVVLLYV